MGRRGARRFVGGVALGAMLAVAHAGEAEWKMLSEQVVPHLTRGNFEQAELIAREALAEARKTFGEDHRNTEASFASLGLALRLRNDYKEAEKN